jgi:hypothetical protein
MSNPQPTTKRRVDTDGPDFYPTPGWATVALLDAEKFDGPIWEPACGDGAMSEVLRAAGYMVVSSDLHNRGYGTWGLDFLTDNRAELAAIPNIVTNPPYALAAQFLDRALAHATGKVALLLRLAFLEGSRRERSIFRTRPPARVYVFSERITFYPSGIQTAGSGTVAYAWFVWDQAHHGPTELHWLNGYKR